MAKNAWQIAIRPKADDAIVFPNQAFERKTIYSVIKFKEEEANFVSFNIMNM